MVVIEIKSQEQLQKIAEIKKAVPLVENATDAVKYALSKVKLDVEVSK